MLEREVDLLVEAPDKKPVVVVEVKNRQNLTREIAIELMRAMDGLGYLKETPYFLLVSQDVGFLWKRLTGQFSSQPELEFSMTEVIHRFSTQNEQDRIPESQLELLVLEWLNTLAWGSNTAEEEPEKSLERVGFLQAIKGAAILAGVQLR